MAVGGPLAAVAAHAQSSVTVYRCESGGTVTLQDEPCPAGADQTTRQMTRSLIGPLPA